MAQEENRVGPLKKVRLSIQAGTSADHMDLTPGPLEFLFIYGIGTSGLAPFEVLIADKREGEECILRLSKTEMPDTFQHLLAPTIDIPDPVQFFVMKVRIISVSDAEQREVIKAMAEIAACGSGCCGH